MVAVRYSTSPPLRRCRSWCEKGDGECVYVHRLPIPCNEHAPELLLRWDFEATAAAFLTLLYYFKISIIMAIETEKSGVVHHDAISPASSEHVARTDIDSNSEIHGFETDLAHLPKGYYRSSFFLGSMAAVGISLTCGVAAFGYAAPLLTQINAELGVRIVGQTQMTCLTNDGCSPTQCTSGSLLSTTSCFPLA